MARQKNIYGRGARTNEHGLLFEQQTDLLDSLAGVSHLTIKGKEVFFNSYKVAVVLGKNEFYKQFIEKLGVDYKSRLSKKMLPDTGLIHHKIKKVFIVEKKFQRVAGSVDEKLQTCDFKLKQYKKLLRDTGYDVGFIYLLSDWFTQKQYRDVKEYIESVGCSYYIAELPLEALTLDKHSLMS